MAAGKGEGRGGRAGRGGGGRGGKHGGGGRARRLFGGGGRGGPNYGAQPLGRSGNGEAEGPGDDCICPQCSYRERHVAGRPCSQRKCPKCGARMAAYKEGTSEEKKD